MSVTWSPAPLTRAELIAAVRQHADLHYATPGWSVIADTWGDDWINEHIGPRVISLRGALRKMAPIVATYAAREAANPTPGK